MKNGQAGDLEYRYFFEAARDGALLLTENRKILDANPAACSILQRRREDLISAGLRDLLDPRSRPLCARALREGGFEGEIMMSRRGDQGFLAEVSIQTIRMDHADRLYVVFRDASESKSVEERLRASEKMFRTTFDRASAGIAHVSPEGRWLRVNQKLCEIVGYSSVELEGKTFQEMTHSDDLEGDLRHLESMLSGQREVYSTEKRYVRKDHSHVWVSLTTTLVRDDAGDPSYFVTIVEEITERKQAESLLRALTPREVEVLRLLVEGHTNRQIASKLMFSVGTAKIHVQRIILKLGVSDRTQAAVLAVRLGLVRG